MRKLAKLLCLVMALSTVSFGTAQAASSIAYGNFTVDGVTFYARTSSSRGDGPIANAFDGDETTVWKANAGGTKGHWVEFDFGKKVLLNGIKYQSVTQMTNGDCNGAFLNYRIEVSNDGEHYTLIERSFKGYSPTMTVLPMQTVYARYMRFAEPNVKEQTTLFGTGAAELRPVIAEAETDAVPSALGIEIHGTAMSGETLTGKYLYNSTAGVDEEGTKYVWYTSGTKDGNLKTAAFGDAEEGISYEIKPEDAGKYLYLAIIPADKNGKNGRKIWSSPVKILSDEEKTAVADAIASFDEQAMTLTAENIVITGTSSGITLPSVEGAAITYKTDNAAYLSSSGAVLKTAAYAGAACACPEWEKDGIVKSLYTANIVYNGIEFTRDIALTIQPAGVQPESESSVYPAYIRNAEDGINDMGLEVKEENGNKAYYKALQQTWGFYEINAFPVYARNITGQPRHDGSVFNRENWNTNTYDFWQKDVGAANITTDTVWIARQFVKADPAGAKTEASIGLVPKFISGMPTDIHREVYPQNITVNSDSWAEMQMLGNRGSDPGWTQFGFMTYNAPPTAVYIDNIELQELRIGSIELSGSDSVEAGTTAEYSGTVLNQFGTTLGMKAITKTVTSGDVTTEYPITPEQTVAYTLKAPARGVSIDSETGILTADENAKPGKVTVVAKISTPKGFVGANGNINDIKGSNITAEKEVLIVNGNQLVITGKLVDGEKLTASENAKWYIGSNPSGDFAELGEGTEITLANAAGRYIKAVAGAKSEVVYIEPKVGADAVFVYKDGVRKADLALEAGKLKVVSRIVNNTGEPKQAAAIIALYENGKLKAVQKGAAADVPANGSIFAEAELAVTAGENDTAKIMIINGTSAEAYEKAVTLNPKK